MTEDNRIPWNTERSPRCSNPLCYPHHMQWHDQFEIWLCEGCGCADLTIGPPPLWALEGNHMGGYLREDIFAYQKSVPVPNGNEVRR